METQKILKPTGKIVIISDYREKEIIEHLKKMDTIVNEMNLEVGDFIASERVAIERKSYNDFIGSIIDGRIFEQATNLRKGFEKSIILIEGYSNREINDNALKAALATLMINFGVSIISTKNPYDTAKTIFWIAKKEQTENKYGVSFKVGKKPKSMKEMQEFIISSIPGISNVLAERLLNHFGSVEKIFNADERELRKVKGIGEKMAKNIRKILTHKY
jgi:Fanconi anemia group M protein